MKWISIKDQLPECFDTVIVCNGAMEKERWVFTYLGERIGKTDSGDPLWRSYCRDCGYDFESFSEEITHWMPLPPKPEKNEFNK